MYDMTTFNFAAAFTVFMSHKLCCNVQWETTL